MAKENPVLHNSNLWLHSKSDSTAQMLSDSGNTVDSGNSELGFVTNFVH